MADVSTVAASVAPAGLTVLVVNALGPVAGQVFLVSLGAVSGAFWAVGKRAAGATPPVLVYMARLVLASVVLTTAAAYALQRWFALPYLDCLLVCSFLLAAFSDQWPRLVSALVDKLTNRQTPNP